MKPVLLLNPNSSQQTTQMLVEKACSISSDLRFVGITTLSSPAIIITQEDLIQSAPAVVSAALGCASNFSGIIVGAFGDPGLSALRRQLLIPVLGLGSASMIEASKGGRRFGIATTTPDLLSSIDACVKRLDLIGVYTGTRLTSADPTKLADDPDALVSALDHAIARCIHEDGADAVIVGGGPLSRAASTLAPRFSQPIISPIEAAVVQMVGLLFHGGSLTGNQ